MNKDLDVYTHWGLDEVVEEIKPISYSPYSESPPEDYPHKPIEITPISSELNYLQKWAKELKIPRKAIYGFFIPLALIPIGVKIAKSVGKSIKKKMDEKKK